MKVEKSKNRGITLIALVITIIVLLILAGVSIATLTGENGILTRANDAKEKNQIGEEKEAIGLAYNGVMTENKGEGVTASQLQDELRNNGYNAKAVDNGDGTITITFGEPSNRPYTIDSNGNIKEAKLPITLEQAKNDDMLNNKEENSTVIVTDGIVTIPAGFKVAQDSGSTINEGIVIEDIKENQFVWVPVEYERQEDGTDNFNEIFVRRAGYYNNSPQILTEDFGEANATGNNTNAEVTESATTQRETKLMYASVKKNGGFYIGRYETGKDKESTVIKKGAPIYNYITWSKNNKMNEEDTVEGAEDNQNGAVELARNFSKENEYTTVTSTLCYGVQWDTTLNWIGSSYIGYEKNSDGYGWYNNNYQTGNPEHNTGIDITNKTNKLKNIYDLAGNVYEWTMESYGDYARVIRGGAYTDSGSNSPVSIRGIGGDLISKFPDIIDY